MSDYTIAKGDCLWTIAKKQYGLQSNADIQKSVDYLAQHNGISNPNLIYAGNTLDLPDIGSILGTQETGAGLTQTGTQGQEGSQEAPGTSDEDIAIFNELDKWQQMHENAAAQMLDGKMSFTDYMALQEEQGDFDFMEGLDPENTEEYDAQTLKLGQGEVAKRDTDDNQQIDFNEYLASEVEAELARFNQMQNDPTLSDDQKMTEEDLAKNLATIYAMSKAAFEYIDKTLGNGDDSLDETEFQQYYQGLDGYTGIDGWEDHDGSIYIDDYEGYANDVMFREVDPSQYVTEAVAYAQMMIANLHSEVV